MRISHHTSKINDCLILHGQCPDHRSVGIQANPVLFARVQIPCPNIQQGSRYNSFRVQYSYLGKENLVLVKDPGQSLHFFPAGFVLIIMIAHKQHLQDLNKRRANDLYEQIISGFVSVSDWQEAHDMNFVCHFCNRI